MIRLRDHLIGKFFADASVVVAFAALALSIFLLMSRVGVVEGMIDRKTKDRIHKSEVKEWRDELQRRNPALDVPPTE